MSTNNRFPVQNTSMNAHGATNPHDAGSIRQTKPLSIVSTILGDCLCVPFQMGVGRDRNAGTTIQFIELHGVEFIGLGAVVDELKPQERVRETVEQLTTTPGRQINIGYLMLEAEPMLGSKKIAAGKLGPPAPPIEPKRITETIPLEIWTKNYPNDRSMAKHLQHTIEQVQNKKLGAAIDDMMNVFNKQKAHPNRNNNHFLVGITAHNLAVLYVLTGQEDKALPLFRQALELKRMAFGESHPQVATSLDEIGIQLFAQEMFEEALGVFHQAKKIRVSALGANHPSVAMASNNIACCNFQLGNGMAALFMFREARNILKDSSRVLADLDLLQVAIVLCNVGYMQIRLKHYEEAQIIFEEALLIQQSVLGNENHPTIKDTRSNMEFTNAFHS